MKKVILSVMALLLTGSVLFAATATQKSCCKKGSTCCTINAPCCKAQ